MQKYAPLTRGITLANVTDGTSNTFLLGEKHVNIRLLGQDLVDPSDNWGTGDHCIYHAEHSWAILRACGVGYSLAKSPTEARYPIMGSIHPGICQFVLCDGSVKTLSNNTSEATLSLLSNRRDGKPVPAF
jgi:hypothetical protein